MNEEILDDGQLNVRSTEAYSPETLEAIASSGLWAKRFLILYALSLPLQFVYQLIVGGAMGFIGYLFLYAVILALIGYPLYQFYKFSQHAESREPEPSFAALADGFKYIGVASLIIIGLYVGLIALMVVIGVGAAAFS